MLNTDRNGNPDARLREQILRYVLRSPRARDPIEGVVEWWLLNEEIERRTKKVDEVLSELVAEGLVLEHKEADGRRVFGINQQKVSEIKALIHNEGKNV